VSIPSQGVNNLLLGQRDLKPLTLASTTLVYDVPRTVCEDESRLPDSGIKIVHVPPDRARTA